MLDNLKVKSILLSEVPQVDKTGWRRYSFYVVIVDDKDTIVWDGKCHLGTGHAKYDNGRMIVSTPKIKDILHSLLMDGTYTDFTDFCENLGYDKDSIKNKKLFRKCMKNYNRLVAYFGKDEIAELHEMFQDY